MASELSAVSQPRQWLDLSALTDLQNSVQTLSGALQEVNKAYEDRADYLLDSESIETVNDSLCCLEEAISAINGSFPNWDGFEALIPSPEKIAQIQIQAEWKDPEFWQTQIVQQVFKVAQAVQDVFRLGENTKEMFALKKAYLRAGGISMAFNQLVDDARSAITGGDCSSAVDDLRETQLQEPYREGMQALAKAVNRPPQEEKKKN